MNSNLTELVFILDMSGSMFDLTNDTIGGFNNMIDNQKKESGDCIVSTVLFNDDQKVLHDRINIKNVEILTRNDYSPNGSTALLDALGKAIHHIGNIHKYARCDDVPNKTLFIITTDGYENSSHIYDYKKISHMVERQKKEYNWEFLFIGANIDVFEVAKKMGIDTKRATSYNNDIKGQKIMYESIDTTIKNYRNCGCINDDWKNELINDKKRVKK